MKTQLNTVRIDIDIEAFRERYRVLEVTGQLRRADEVRMCADSRALYRKRYGKDSVSYLLVPASRARRLDFSKLYGQDGEFRISSADPREMEDFDIANLLSCALAHQFLPLRAGNVTGRCLICPSDGPWRQPKRGKSASLSFIDMRFNEACSLNMSIVTFTPYLMLTGKDFGRRKKESYTRFVYDSDLCTMAYADASTPLEATYLLKQRAGVRFSACEFFNFEPESWQRSKCGVAAAYLRLFNEAYEGIARLTQDEPVEELALDFSGLASIDASSLQGETLLVLNVLEEGEREAFAAVLEAIAASAGFDRIGFRFSSDMEDAEKADLAVHYEKEHYAECSTPDPYPSASSLATQHIGLVASEAKGLVRAAFELGGGEEVGKAVDKKMRTIMENALCQLAIKRDISRGEIVCGSWPKGHAATFAIALCLQGAKAEDGYSHVGVIDVSTAGEIRWRAFTMPQACLPDADDAMLSLAARFVEEHANAGHLLCGRFDGDDFDIYDTPYFPMPDLAACERNAKENLWSLSGAECARALKHAAKLAEQDGSAASAHALLDASRQVEGMDAIARPELKRVIGAAGKPYDAKPSKYADAALRAECGKGLIVSRSKRRIEEHYPSLLGAHAISWNGDVLYWFGPEKSNQANIERNARARLLKAKGADSVGLFERMLPFYRVDFVRFKRATVVPFPIKYAREIAAKEGFRAI